MCVGLGLLSWCFVIPLQFAQDGEHYQVFNTVIDAIFLVDVVVCFRTPYFTQQGRLMMNTGAIASNYLKTWFAIDVLAVFPFKEIVSYAQGTKLSEADKILALIKFLRLLKVSRLFRIAQFIDLYRLNSPTIKYIVNMILFNQ